MATEEYFSSHTKFDEATEDIDELIQEEIEDVVDIEVPVPNLDYQCQNAEAEQTTLNDSMSQVLCNIRNNYCQGTPRMINNKFKLQRSAARDSESVNGTPAFSTRSTLRKTPLLFGRNSHAKLRDISRFR